MLQYSETEALSPAETPFFVLSMLLFLLFVLFMQVPPFSYLLPSTALSMLADFEPFAPFCTAHSAVCFPILCKSYPATRV